MKGLPAGALTLNCASRHSRREHFIDPIDRPGPALLGVVIDLLVHAKIARALKHSALHAGTRLWEQFVAPIDRPGTPLAATKYPPDELIPGFKQHVEVRNPVASQRSCLSLARGAASCLTCPNAVLRSVSCHTARPPCGYQGSLLTYSAIDRWPSGWLAVTRMSSAGVPAQVTGGGWPAAARAGHWAGAAGGLLPGGAPTI